MNLSMRGIYKSFGANDVLKSVDFHLSEGEICALLGENGAGKSTLMNILGGVLQPDQGTIALDGAPVQFHNPSQSLDAGIAFIHQELNLINDLPVYENMFIGREIKKKSGLLDHKAMIARTRELFESMSLDIDPLAMVSALDASYKQIVEISRALMMKASIIIMDEPTTSLTDPEIERVFQMLRTLRQQKVGVVFISHKLREVMQICDRYTVLRDGAVVAEGLVRDTSVENLARDMVGHEVRTQARTRNAQLGVEVLRLESLTLEPYYRNVSLSIHAGEVLGFSGLVGAGRTETMRAVIGADRMTGGEVLLDGKKIHCKSPHDAMRHGIVLVPEDRKMQGILANLDVCDNINVSMLEQHSNRLGVLNRRSELETAEKGIRDFRIRTPSPHKKIVELSGGNQQKCIVARWLGTNPRVLILDEPTKGIDVGAKAEFYRMICEFAKQGLGVILISSELPEVIGLSDRIIVMRARRVAGEVMREDATEDRLLALGMVETDETQNRREKA